MPPCPVCGSRQVVSLISPRRSVCGDCGSAWVREEGSVRLLSASQLVSFLPSDRPPEDPPAPRRRWRPRRRAS